ncbi:hypothetical protein ILUMI_07046 [Ignelater luminosus]|uniref:S1 motif domain-containing protein n=1 Tax=Ignelater luminosus TaxID=2038154 RepID=A0A8K0DA11_IGNLU|nr:hypothetical protein ILUMI_07046 [Ignelater luminosus]
MHIIASVIATDTDVLALLRKLRTETNFFIECKRSNTKKDASTTKSTKASKTAKLNNVDEEKFSTYFDFKISQKFIKPHQILAINRGEALKVLSVKVVVPDFVFNRFSNFCAYRWINKGNFNHTRKRILEMSVKDSYTRLVQPYIVREVRSEMKSKAEKASYEVFSTNLKQLLLMPPLKGRPILGIDPGYSNGCKMAVISETGSVLANAVVYPHKNKTDRDATILRNMLKDHNCSLIALGNGTACRETEAWLSDLLQNNTFAPLDVTYTIVNESGASIYSCSAEAKKEFSSLDPNIISAISLARRVQEPLAELVKVEPKHLGVGMYQHDLPKKQLEQALDEVVMECVSFVGVDLNTASQCLLKHIAGLTEKRAAQIIEYREKKGSFVSRKQLKEVKGIGPRVFEQCAGFLRVGPVTPNQSNEFYKNASTNRLDCTYIHPESYDVTLKVLKKLDLKLNDIGQQSFINAVKLKIPLLNSVELSSSLGSSVETINLILEALSKPLNFDLRSDCTQKPLFKKGLTSIYDLNVGCTVTGSVTNITHFGCFVDIGVGQDGLIHQSKLNGFNLQIGDKVEVKVINLEIDRKRIGLQTMNKL